MASQKSSKCDPPVVSGCATAVAEKTAGGATHTPMTVPNGPAAVGTNARERVTGPTGFGLISSGSGPRRCWIVQLTRMLSGTNGPGSPGDSKIVDEDSQGVAGM